jgi:uncharacterized membrane protein YoaK (UPF0700 family)
MSGNSVAMAAYAGQGHWAEAARRAFPIPLFVAGVALGASIAEQGQWGLTALLLPLAGLTCLILADLLAPLPMKSER